MAKPVPLADRALQRDSIALLQGMIDRIRAGQVPRWVLANIAPRLQVAVRLVRGVNREHDCIESGCVGAKAEVRP